MSWLAQFREDNRILGELLAGPFGKFYAIAAAATFFSSSASVPGS